MGQAYIYVTNNCGYIEPDGKYNRDCFNRWTGVVFEVDYIVFGTQR